MREKQPIQREEEMNQGIVTSLYLKEAENCNPQ